MSRLLCCALALAVAAPGSADEQQIPKAPRLLLPGDKHDLAFSDDGKLLATAGGDAVRVWEVPSGKHRQTLTSPGRGSYRAVVRAGGLLLGGGGDNGDLALWDFRTGRVVRQVAALAPGVSYLASWRAGKVAAVRVMGGQIQIAEFAAGRSLAFVRPAADPPRTAEFSPDGTKLVTAGGHVYAEVWETSGGQRLRSLGDGQGQVTGAAFTPDGKGLVVGATHSIVLWDVKTGEEVRRFGKDEGTGALAVSDDGRTLAAARGPGRIGLWDVQTGKLRRELDGGHRHTWRLAFAPDGKTLAASGVGETHVCLWDLDTGRRLGTLPGAGR